MSEWIIYYNYRSTAGEQECLCVCKLGHTCLCLAISSSESQTKAFKTEPFSFQAWL